MNIKKQVILMLYAFSFFSRMPIPRSLDFKAYPFHLGNSYFPVVGLVAALISFAAYTLGHYVFDNVIGVIFMLIAGIMFTGAFHEDGLADCCDAFGGGYDKAQRLKIMKDSQIGTYGGLGLILLILSKTYLLFQLLPTPTVLAFAILIFVAMFSRFSTLLVMQFSRYAREGEGAKSALTSYCLPVSYLCMALLVSLLPLLFIPIHWGFISILVVFISTWLCWRYFERQLGGYTGDCLGFTQQLNEILLLLLLVNLPHWLPLNTFYG